MEFEKLRFNSAPVRRRRSESWIVTSWVASAVLSVIGPGSGQKSFNDSRQLSSLPCSAAGAVGWDSAGSGASAITGNAPKA